MLQHQQMHIVNGGTASSSNRGQYKEKRNGVVLDASSVDSAADIRHVLSTQSQGQRSPPSIGTLKLQYQPRSQHSVEQRAAPRKFHPKNSSLKVVSIDKVRGFSCSRTWMVYCLYWDCLKWKKKFRTYMLLCFDYIGFLFAGRRCFKTQYYY